MNAIAKSARVGVAAAIFGLLGACANPSDVAGVPENISYNWHVRPILSENCFKCHGPDAEGREASLRLDSAEFAFNRLEGPRERYAIVPGDPDSGELIWRINAPNQDDVMPPVRTYKSLTDREKAILRQWIADSAEYQRHWAFLPLEDVPAPRTGFDDRAVNGIDPYIFAGLEREGMTPAPEADRTDNALGTAFMGLTLGCARCHDHRYDPISQREYYELGAFFNSNDEPGHYAPGYSGIRAGPTLPWPSDEQRVDIDAAAALVAEREAAYGSALADATAATEATVGGLLAGDGLPALDTLRVSLERGLAAHYAFETATPAELTDLRAPPAAAAADYADRIHVQSARSAAVGVRDRRGTPGGGTRSARAGPLQRR